MKRFAKQPKLTERTPVTVDVVRLCLLYRFFCFSSFVLRSIAKNNESTIFLLYLKSFQVCFKSHHFIYQITKVSYLWEREGCAPLSITIRHARGKLSDRSHTYVFRKRPLERTDLRVRRMKTHIGDRAFSAAGPRCWNSLPSAIRVVYSVDSFKAQVKT